MCIFIGPLQVLEIEVAKMDRTRFFPWLRSLAEANAGEGPIRTVSPLHWGLKLAKCEHRRSERQRMTQHFGDAFVRHDTPSTSSFSCTVLVDGCQQTVGWDQNVAPCAGCWMWLSACWLPWTLWHLGVFVGDLGMDHGSRFALGMWLVDGQEAPAPRERAPLFRGVRDVSSQIWSLETTINHH